MFTVTNGMKINEGVTNNKNFRRQRRSEKNNRNPRKRLASPRNKQIHQQLSRARSPPIHRPNPQKRGVTNNGRGDANP